jgi:hypothetical protein
MTTPEEAAYHPGPSPVLWAPSLVNMTEVPWRPGFAAWHRTWGVWVRLVAEVVYGERPPTDAILLTPENASDGTPDMAQRLDRLERMIQQLGD